MKFLLRHFQIIYNTCTKIIDNTSFGNKHALQSFLLENIKRYQWQVGSWSYGFLEIVGVGEAHLQIGSYVSIARGCKIYLGYEHNVDWVTTYPFPASPLVFPNSTNIEGHPKTKVPVYIGNDVWIGEDVKILSGSHIADGAVIGAKSLVSGLVKPYSIVGGIPARLINYRFTSYLIQHLLDISWWDWSDADVHNALPLLCSNQIEPFVEKYRSF